MSEGERRRIGQRYELFGAMAAGGTSTVHLGRLHGTAGFVKPIAVKRLHPHLAADPTLRRVLVEEARLVSRISHPNVVAVLDIVEDEGELFLVLEYVHGATVSELVADGRRLPPPLAVAILKDALTGLHAAHHARDASGALLGLVHRDVSPRNVIVTTDGIGKILDFGIAKARARQSSTREGHVRGSLPYMAPEQLGDEPLTARTDVYGAAVVLWEALTGARLFDGETEAAIVKRILDHDVRAPSTVVPELPRALDAVVLRGLARDPEQRFASGLEMALALEASLAPARSAEVGVWVTAHAETELARRQALLDGGAEVEEPAAALPAAPPVTVSEGFTEALLAPPGRWRWRVATLAAVVVVSLVAMRFFGELGTRVRSGAMPGASVAASAAAAPTPAEPSAPAIASAGATAAAPVEESARPARPSVPVPSAPRPTARAAVPPPPPPSADCPPYFVDSAGVRRFNRECLK